MVKFSTKPPQTAQQVGYNDRPESRRTVTQNIPSSDLKTHKHETSSAAIISSSDPGELQVKHKKSQKLMKLKQSTQKPQYSGKTATDSPPTTLNPPAILKGGKMGELSRDDVIIAVMGPSGSGKSTFINTVANSNVAIGHRLESCTSEISTIRLSFPDLVDSDIVFVDTPGFDHTNKTEIEILKMVADWLKTTYEKDILLSGLLYCHRISYTQMAATSVRHLRIFEELCGKNALQNIVLVTTMWDEVDKATGELEEEKMKTNYWNKMLERSSRTARFLGTRESAHQLLRPLIDAANRRSSLLLQHEMVNMGKKLTETSAGRHLFARAGHFVLQRQEVIQRIRNQMKRPSMDRISLQPLHQEHQKLTQCLESTVEEMRALDLPVGRRVLDKSERWFSQKFLNLKSMLTGTVKAQGEEGVDCIEGEANHSNEPLEVESSKKSQGQADELRED